MEGAASQLIKAVEEQRTKRRLDHRAFSALLGIHESYWHRIRTGERSPNLNILTIFMQKLPEVTTGVTIYIMQQSNNDTIQKVKEEEGASSDNKAKTYK